MTTDSRWVRPLVGVAALLAMSLPLLAAGDGDAPVDEESVIRALLDAQNDAWNRGDIEGFMEAYQNSDDLLFASGDQVTRGWRTTLERYQSRYDSPEKMGKLASELLEVQLLGTRHAKVLGTWRLIREEDSPHGLYTLILAKQGGEWRIIHDHTSSAVE